MRRSLMLAAPALALALLTGCSASVSIGGDVVPAAELAIEVTAALSESEGVPLDEMPPITCPEDLDAAVGATTTCALTDTENSQTYDVTVKVTSVEDGKAKFDIRVADAPRQ